MLRLLLRSPFRLLIGLDRSCLTSLRLLHDTVPETLKPSASDVTVSYLVGSCGLSPAVALNAAKRITLKTTDRANSFLSLFIANGFTKRQIAHIVTICPELLTYDQEKKIMPKLEFFHNLGYSSSEVANIISTHPDILRYSLENSLSPNFRMLSGILGSDREVIISVRRAPRILAIRLDRVLLPNMKTLLDIGVPHHNIVKMTTYYPRGMMKTPSEFNKSVDWLKKIGFDVSKPEFIVGLNTISVLSPSTWEKKLELYRSLGWSEETILTAFRKYPPCIAFSEEKIMKNYSFFLEKMKCEPSYMSARPFLLYYSFEKRILPRYKIFCMLESKGLTKMNMNFIPLLYLTREKFTDEYVTKYADQIPELLKVYMDD